MRGAHVITGLLSRRAKGWIFLGHGGVFFPRFTEPFDAAFVRRGWPEKHLCRRRVALMLYERRYWPDHIYCATVFDQLRARGSGSPSAPNPRCAPDAQLKIM